MRITNEVLEAYLYCKTKAHLKVAGENGVISEYEAMTKEAMRRSREDAVTKLAIRYGEGGTRCGVSVTAETLKKGAPLLARATLDRDFLSLDFDALKRIDGLSKVGEHHYLPVLYSDKISWQQKQLLAMLGLALADVQGLRPTIGLIAHGAEGQLRKVRLDAKLYRQAEQVLDEVKRLQAVGELPRLTLNKHCQICEFQQRCRMLAEETDNISLLAGVGEKELKGYNRKGIFTLTQLSCTFRPRKRGKRVKQTNHLHYPALKALAIREKKIHVNGNPDLRGKPVQIFFDVEGVKEGSFVYLLGALIAQGDTTKMHSFWADSQTDEARTFDSFLDLLETYEEFCLFHYGGYEKAFLRRMRKLVDRQSAVDRLLDNAVNVLSAIRNCVYFPTLSNGLKDIGRYLGCVWTAENASGLQSLVWRDRWEQDRESVWKENLLTYNADDCIALKKVTECVQAIAEVAKNRSSGALPGTSPSNIAWADDIGRSLNRREFGDAQFAIEDFDHVNRCAYFDYQREKVFVRSSRVIEKARRSRAKTWSRLPSTREVKITDDVCPFCKGSRITRLFRKVHSRLAYDLEFIRGGLRRRVIRCTASWHQCEDCRMTFPPRNHQRRDKHLHGLKSWAMYQHIVHRVNLGHVSEMLVDLFGLRVNRGELHGIRALMANRYRKTCDRILARIVGGRVAHGDETEVDLVRSKGYVWVVANMEDVLYLYKPSREAGFLRDLLADFNGVLVSDFYCGYDSLPCKQQKCLVHLIRDFNADLMSSPYDEEFKTLAAEFGRLLRVIVDTIDKHGLAKRHLQSHKDVVSRFFRDLEARVYRSELAVAYQARFAKIEGKLFTFLDYDGIPWNNNPAEHAVKAFASYRQLSDGMLSEQGLSDYLVLLSVEQTCKYRGVSFLRFLLSQEEDVDVFRRHQRKKPPRPTLEVYPEDFCRMNFNRTMEKLTDS